MESENIVEVIQEGGGYIQGSDTLLTDVLQQTLDTATIASRRVATRMRNFTLPNLANPTLSIRYTDRPLLLSDLVSLMAVGRPSSVSADPSLQNLFDSIPLAQYKHLPDPSYLLVEPQGGGSIDETTLDTQEVSLPSEASEEDLPSLDIVEPSSTGGSYKRSSHKKRKSTRSRTKKNKKL